MKSLKQSKRMLKGVILMWKDAGPSGTEAQIYDADCTHTSPVFRLAVKDMWARYSRGITKKFILCWCIQIKARFKSKSGVEVEEAIEASYRGRFTDLATEIAPYLEELGAAREELVKELYEPVDFVCFEFRVECMGDTSPKAAHYSIEKTA